MTLVTQGVFDRPKATLLSEGPARHERLARLTAEHPELGSVAPFWLAIHQAQLDTWTTLAALPLPAWTPCRNKWTNGQPQVEFHHLGLTPRALDESIGKLEATWRLHDPSRAAAQETDWTARAIEVLADPTRWFGQRRELAFEDALIALALQPHLEWLAATVMQAIEGELDAWEQGCCPACGGWPDLAVLLGEPATRSLVCGRCGSAWPFRRVGCPFCGDLERQVYYPSDDGKARLDACESCRRYLKTLEGRYLTGGLDPHVTRLATIAMDVAALKAGYGPA